MHDLHSFRIQPCLYRPPTSGDLILAPRINPRILPRQQQLYPGVEDAGHLQGRDGAAALVVAQMVLLAGVVDRQAFLAQRRCRLVGLALDRFAALPGTVHAPVGAA